MEYDSTRPIWLQVVERIKGEMVTGRLSPGSRMPSGRDLALRYSINPNTAARVYQALESEALCETRRGIGTFVTSDTARIQALRAALAREALQRFLQSLRELGFDQREAIHMLISEEEQSNA